MRELEKILEEIEEGTHTFELFGRDVDFVAIDWVRDVIRKHMNDGWIPVDDHLPERTLDEKLNKSYKKYLVFIDSVDGWDIDMALYNFWNDKKWSESHDGYGEIENVIAWRPLPEPYRPEQPETCKYTGGSCCWPIDQCRDCPNHPRKERRRMTPEEAIEALRLEGGIDITGKPKRIAEFFEGLDMAIEAIKEIQQYREIGTMEECREAREKQKPKVPEFIHMLGEYTGKFKCPVCEKLFSHDCTDMKVFFCKKCGQALRMENEDD